MVSEDSKMTDISELTAHCSPTLSIADFALLKVIGVGSYGKVMLVRKNDSGELLAMKMLRKEHLIKRNQVEHTKTERRVLETVKHPFIVKLRYAFQNPKKLYFLLEYCPGGELFFHLQKAGRFDEDRAKFYAAQMVLALGELHKHDVVYRDLKPENVLIDSEGYIKLTDFGLSKENIKDGTSAHSFCGTPEYLAPEILKKVGHGKPVDWWSMGAIIFEMLTGLPPFYTKDREKLFYNIKFAELKYPPYISSTCKDLLTKLFNKDPTKRLGGSEKDSAEIMEHPWFAKTDWTALYSKALKPIFKPKRLAETDTVNFDTEFTSQPAADSLQGPGAHLDQGEGKWDGFSYQDSEMKEAKEAKEMKDIK